MYNLLVVSLKGGLGLNRIWCGIAICKYLALWLQLDSSFTIYFAVYRRRSVRAQLGKYLVSFKAENGPIGHGPSIQNKLSTSHRAHWIVEPHSAQCHAKWTATGESRSAPMYGELTHRNVLYVLRNTTRRSTVGNFRSRFDALIGPHKPIKQMGIDIFNCITECIHWPEWLSVFDVQLDFSNQIYI